LTAYELIRSRRSIYDFEPRPVGRELVEQALQAATWAPNRGLTQPWRFVIVEPAAAAVPAADERTAAAAAQAPLAVAVLQRPAPDPSTHDADRLAVGAAIQNLLLCAWDAGLGSLWVDGGLADRRSLAAEAEEDIAALVLLGYPESVPPVRHRRRAAELTDWRRF
jgi:nitroreductase